ncbi:SWIM zinc finger family protein [Oricola sp.]|uniref:SWIM zinc finger family protein n=1 Tax=Oricola sp. TaxID=1979950 RepID=UPI0025D7B0AA|nr:SWIM zinc finger family protein [Oricola sp.]MCI5075046.1 SWIM zinc finger domain-containing protein [Oricola sp.]
MSFSLADIEKLAPDQASLNAASKLTKPSKWPRLEFDDKAGLYWGECQGSGSNPYRVVIDAGDHGYKCTCPSRKFPCKHAIALMWMVAGDASAFHPAETPGWVSEWLGRRRKTAPTEGPSQAGAPKSIATAGRPEKPEPAAPEAIRQREVAAAKRREKTQAAIAEAMGELDQWVGDQLRTGLNAFVADATERCRRIAARMVDLKAGALGGRIDEVPSRILTLDADEKPTAAMIELGKLVIIAKAWRRDPDDAEMRRIVSTSETRDQLLSDPAAFRVTSTWEVVGEQIRTRPDGLVSHSTWLLDLLSPTPRFALLLDFHPASTGRRESAFADGERFDADIVYYPARSPMRAVIGSRQALSGNGENPWPKPATDHRSDQLRDYAQTQATSPWLASAPVLLEAGSLALGPRNRVWWQTRNNDMALPLANAVPEPALGLDLERSVGIWNGLRLELLSAETRVGRVSFDD